MKFNETEILKKVFWPEDKSNGLGNLFFTNTTDEFINTKTIGAARTEKTLEIFYTIAPMLEPDKKEYFIKLIFNREDGNIILNTQKSSPEVKSENDVNDVLENIQNSILMMNSKPEFFMIGIIKNKLKLGI